MKRTLIIIITFCTGILVGVCGTFLYQIWGRPTLPKVKVERCRLDFLYGMPDDELFGIIDAIKEANA